MNIEAAKLDILEEAAKHHNQIFKMETQDGYYVKGHSLPDELRCTYIAALDFLVKDGSLKVVFRNKDFQLYEINAAATEVTTIQSATERLLSQLNATGSVYKIHSNQGEFVQCGEKAFDQFEAERILFMRALHALLYRGKIRAVSETRQMCRFELTPSHTQSAVYEAA